MISSHSVFYYHLPDRILVFRTMPVIAAKRTLRSHPSSPPRKSPRRCTAATPNSTPTVIPQNPNSPPFIFTSLSVPLTYRFLFFHLQMNRFGADENRADPEAVKPKWNPKGEILVSFIFFLSFSLFKNFTLFF